MASGVNFYSGLINLFSSIRGTNGKPDGLLAGLMAGTDQSAQFGAPKFSPHQYIPDSFLCHNVTFDRFVYPMGPGENWNITTDGGGTGGSATGGNGAGWFTTLTGGTIAQTSAQAGYVGKTVLGGSATPTTISMIHTKSVLPVAKQLIMMYGRFFFTDPNLTSGWSFQFGFGNKTADPITTPFTDGTWIQGSTSAGAVIFAGKNAASSLISTTVLAPAAAATIASGVPRSIEMAVCIQGSGATAVQEFWVRDPTLATNTWSRTAVTNANGPIVALRPHIAFLSGSANAKAVQCGTCYIAAMQPTTF